MGAVLQREYEMVLMLDPEAPDERREEIAAGARQRIESAGELKHADAWGVRKMSYEIERRNEADYRFYRFVAESPVLNDLDHTLKITDGVLRFRIFKVDAATPVLVPPPAMQPARAGKDAREATRRPRRGGREEERTAADAQAEEEAEAAREAASAPATPAETAPAAAAAPDTEAVPAAEPTPEAEADPEAEPAAAAEAAPEAEPAPEAEQPAPEADQSDAADDGGEPGEPAAS